MNYILLLCSIFLGICGQLLLKKGVMASSLSPNFVSIFKTLLSPLVFSGLLLYGLSAIIWLFVLQRFPLSVAYPSLALSYVVIVILSSIFLKEPLSQDKIIGTILIFGGVAFLFR